MNSNKQNHHHHHQQQQQMITLSNLYKNEQTRYLVWDVLSENFNAIFEKLLNNAKNIKSLLYLSAKRYRESIKFRYIEHGAQLQSLEDIKIILDELTSEFESVGEDWSDPPPSDTF